MAGVVRLGKPLLAETYATMGKANAVVPYT